MLPLADPLNCRLNRQQQGSAGFGNSSSLIDMSDFPSLAPSPPNGQATATKANMYSRMAMQSTSQAKFQMANEDFPALGGMQNKHQSMQGGINHQVRLEEGIGGMGARRAPPFELRKSEPK